MITMPSYDDVINYIIKEKEAKRTYTSLALELKVDRRTVAKWHRRGLELNGHRLIPTEPLFDISRFQAREHVGDCMVTCDWHLPLHSPDMINQVILKAKKHDIKTLIIGGDYLNLDTFSHYLPHQAEAAFALEKQVAVEVLDVLLDHFEEVEFFWGNHEHRISRFLDFKLSFEECMRWILAELGNEKLSRCNFSELDYMWIWQPDTFSRPFRFSHQKNFSKIPLTVPRQLATKYNCNIITAHSHHCAMGVGLDGENIIIEGGCLVDKDKTEYVQHTSLHHEWVQGFTMFKDGIPTLFSPAFGNLKEVKINDNQQPALSAAV